MPLFNYMCLKCNLVIEKFQHKPETPEVECEECGGEKFEKVIGVVYQKVRYNAKDTFKNRIAPEIDRITDNISKGKDKDFLDVAGE